MKIKLGLISLFVLIFGIAYFGWRYKCESEVKVSPTQETSALSIKEPVADSETKASSTSPLPLPRFASLRSKTVNLHVGPGKNYHIEWTFVRSRLPVEIIAEFDTWRQIRDWQGTQGWVHKSLLCGKRTAVIQQKQRKLFKETDENSRVVVHLEPGVLGDVLECRNDWCRLDVQGHRGWIKRRFIWGVYPHEDKFK